MAGDVYQQAVRDRLSRQTCTRGAERHGYAVLPAERKQSSDLVDAVGLYDRFRDQAIEAGIGGVGDEFDGADEDARGVDSSGKFGFDFFRRKLHGN